MRRIEIEGVSVAFRRRRRSGLMRSSHAGWALRDLDLHADAGEFVGVIGPNGAGKTTLLQTVAGVIRPTRGRLVVNGRATSLVDLTAGFHRELNGYENSRVQGPLLGLSRGEVRDRFDEIKEFSGLDDETLEQPLRTFSAGMALRLGFALVTCVAPEVLLVDEVLAVGDEVFQHRCLRWIDERRAAGAAVLLVTHDLDVAAEHADRLVLLHDGQVEAEGDPAAVIARYHEVTAAIEGRSS